MAHALWANRALAGRLLPLRPGAAGHCQPPQPRERSFNCLLSWVSDYFEEEGTKFVILRYQTFNEAQVTSDSAYGVNKEYLSAFVEDFVTSVSIDFPDDEEYVGEVLDCGSSDISVHGRTEEAQHADEKDDRSSSIPEVVITQADELTAVFSHTIEIPSSCVSIEEHFLRCGSVYQQPVTASCTDVRNKSSSSPSTLSQSQDFGSTWPKRQHISLLLHNFLGGSYPQHLQGETPDQEPHQQFWSL
ncbi:uncharacterized protein [Emydura macquarii macquarii]|uniref:uncharacterized protein n=1 Tax=Emydura macquarii macquarii TaxID=1129001 RepID=UPI00352A071A